jgi:hypothetical protein
MTPEEEELEVKKIMEGQINDVLGDIVPPVIAEGKPDDEKPGDENLADGKKEDESESTKPEDKKEDEGKVDDEDGKPEGEKVVVKPVVEPKVDDEMELLKKQNELLLKRVEELASGSVIPKVVKPDDKKADDKVDDLDVIGDLDIDEVVSDKKLFNQVVGIIIKAAREQARNEVMTALPQSVSGHVTQQMMVQKTTDAFYEENKDLLPVRKTVAYVAAEIYASKPDVDMKTLYIEAAKKTREILGMREPVIENKDDVNVRRRNPEFPSSSKGGNRGKKSGGEVDAIQKDINDTLGI